jgi:hypothetical protein
MQLLGGVIWQADAMPMLRWRISGQAVGGRHHQRKRVELGSELRVFFAHLHRRADIAGPCLHLDFCLVHFEVPGELCVQLTALIVPLLILCLGHLVHEWVRSVVFSLAGLSNLVRFDVDTLLAIEGGLPCGPEWLQTIRAAVVHVVGANPV